MNDFVTDRRAMIGAGALLAGSAAMVAPKTASAQSGGAKWEPKREALDDWYDLPGTLHRMLFDTTSVAQLRGALGYANNCYFVTWKDYGQKPQDLGMILILRHFSTPFAFNDAMWKKYGKLFAEQLELKGNEAIRATTVNPFLTDPPADAPPAKDAKPKEAPKPEDQFNEVTLGSFGRRGARFAVCALATKGVAGGLASKTKGDAKAIEAELIANLIPGGHMVPAGIIAVNRAQERGYTPAVVID